MKKTKLSRRTNAFDCQGRERKRRPTCPERRVPSASRRLTISENFGNFTFSKITSGPFTADTVLYATHAAIFRKAQRGKEQNGKWRGKYQSMIKIKSAI
jgi:hypothetical protein